MSRITPESARTFILAHTALRPVPHAPEIRLHVADEATALWQKTEEELEAIGLPPPFWAFAWPGGQALARHVLDHPDAVRGKRVLDFAAGCGIAAIACARAGASEVEAAEIDPLAAAAIRFDHIHLRSPDPEATARWFAEMLGAEIVRSVQDGQPRVDLKLGGADIFIAPVPPGDAGVGAPPRPPHQGLDHFGLAVPDLDAAAAAAAPKAKGVGFTPEPKRARPGLRIAFVRGPQGISIESLRRG